VTDSQHAQEWSQSKNLQNAVLRYLSVNGPKPWGEIYALFEQQESGASISEALRRLVARKAIAIIGGLTTITALGIEQLERPSD
jgi:hypothetical protein